MRALLGGLPAIILFVTLLPSAQADEQSAPENVQVQAIGESILVTWLPPQGAAISYYTVQRVNSPSAPAVVGPDTTEFLDTIDALTSLAASYVVSAVYPDGTSAPAVGVGIFLERLGPFCSIVIDITMPQWPDVPCVAYTVIDRLPEPMRTEAANRWEFVWDLINPQTPEGEP